MNRTRVGFLTIGQSPREDIIPEIKPLLHPNIEVIEYGLLDNLSQKAIKALCPDPQKNPLVSRMKDGNQVQLSENKISKLLSQAIEFMNEKMSVKAVGVLCTHEFPAKKSSCPTIFPFDCMKFIIDEILEAKKLGIIVPLESQKEMTLEKWGKERTCIVAKSPYTEGKTWEDVANSLIREKVDAVVLDCIGYRMRDRHEFQNILSVPTILPRSILAFAINQLF